MSETAGEPSTAVALIEDSGARARPKRTVVVTAVAVIAFAVAAYALVYGVIDVLSGENDRLALGSVRLAVGVGAIVVGFGTLKLRSWAWVVFMTGAVVALTHQILRVLFFGDPSYADLGVAAFVVFALSPLDVQIAFGLRHTENVDLARATRNPLDRD